MKNIEKWFGNSLITCNMEKNLLSIIYVKQKIKSNLLNVSKDTWSLNFPIKATLLSIMTIQKSIKPHLLFQKMFEYFTAFSSAKLENASLSFNNLNALAPILHIRTVTAKYNKLLFLLEMNSKTECLLNCNSP